MQGISQGKGFGFVVGPARSVISASADYFLLVLVQYHESSGPMPILRSPIELNVDMWAGLKTGSRGQMNRLLKGFFGGLHVFRLGRVFNGVGFHS